MKSINIKEIILKNKKAVLVWGIVIILLLLSLVMKPKPPLAGRQGQAAADTNTVLCTLSIPKPKYADIKREADKAGLSPVAYLTSLFNNHDTIKR